MDPPEPGGVAGGFQPPFPSRIPHLCPWKVGGNGGGQSSSGLSRRGGPQTGGRGGGRTRSPGCCPLISIPKGGAGCVCGGHPLFPPPPPHFAIGWRAGREERRRGERGAGRLCQGKERAGASQKKIFGGQGGGGGAGGEEGGL